MSIPVIAVGLITDPQHAEQILENQQADVIGLARAMLYDPRWPWHAAATLGAKVKIAPQYLRCQPHGLKQLFDSFSFKYAGKLRFARFSFEMSEEVVCGFQVILPILILLLMGYCSVLIKLVTPEQIKALSAFVIKISLPAF